MSELKKKIRPGAIELHADELALLVHYEVQEVAQQADGSQEVTSSSQATKKITVKSLSERTDLSALAAEVVEKCKLIHPSKTGHVQELLLQLQQRQLQSTAAAAEQASTSEPATAVAAPSAQQAQQPTSGTSASVAAASPGRPDSSASSTHSSSPRPGSAAAAAAAAAARPGSAAARPASAHRSSSQQQQQQGAYPSSPGNSPTRMRRQQQQQQQTAGEEEAAMQQQQQQLQQRTVVQASEIFEALTPASPPAFLDEIEAYIEGLYDEDLAKRAAAAGMLCQLFRNTANTEALLSRENLLTTLSRLLREDSLKSLELATAVAGCFLACSTLQQLHRLLLENQVGTLLMDLVSLELLQRTPAREAQEGPGSSAADITARAAAARARTAAPLGDRERRLASLVVRQDRFLYIATATLLHLAEDTAVQRKMRKKDIVGLVVALLNRPHVELLLLATGFLRRLCVFVENKDRLASLPGVVPQLLALLHPGCGDALQTSVLRLLHNLSFDGALRQQMVLGGLVPQAVQLLDSPHSAPLAAGLLYQLSMDDGAKSVFAFCPGALPRLHESIMRAMGASGPGGGLAGPEAGFAGFAGALAAAGGGGGDLRSVPELIALAVNLAISKRTAEWYCTGERLERLLKRALAAADELAWKLLHNLALSGGEDVGGRLLVHARGMLALLQSPNTGPELFAEVLGTLAAACDALSNSSGSGDGSSSSLLGQLVCMADVMGLLQACFEPGALEDDALLAAVVLVGALAGQPETDQDLADSGLLMRLVELITVKRADDEFVLQVCWAFSRSLMQPGTTQALLACPQVVPYLIDLLHDSCGPVVAVVGGCLDVIMDRQQDLAGTIRSLKFEAHNQEWLRLAGPGAHQLAAAAAAGPGWPQGGCDRGPSGARRSAVSGSVEPAYAGQYQAAPSSSSSSAYPDTAAASGYYQDHQDQAGPDSQAGQYQEPEGYGQMQWVTSGAGGAGGQRMVLDLDEFVAGGIEEGGGAVGMGIAAYG